MDPQWQASALLVKQLIRGLSSGYEPWKVLVRYRVSQTRQSRIGRWPVHSNWMMNARNLVKQRSPLWQGIMKAWQTIQSGLEQQDPTCWAEIIRQPIVTSLNVTSFAPRAKLLTLHLQTTLQGEFRLATTSPGLVPTCPVLLRLVATSPASPNESRS